MIVLNRPVFIGGWHPQRRLGIDNPSRIPLFVLQFAVKSWIVTQISTSDEQLAAQVDRGGFELLYERHASHVLAFLTRLAGHSDAGDVAQDVWIKVHAALPKAFSGGTVKKWLFSIARNQHIDHTRKRPFAELKVDLPDNTPNTFDALLDTERFNRLGDCLATLRQSNLRSADVLVLLLKGIDVADICVEMKLDAQQVYNIKNKTIPVLQDCVSKERA